MGFSPSNCTVTYYQKLKTFAHSGNNNLSGKLDDIFCSSTYHSEKESLFSCMSHVFSIIVGCALAHRKTRMGTTGTLKRILQYLYITGGLIQNRQSKIQNRTMAGFCFAGNTFLKPCNSRDTRLRTAGALPQGVYPGGNPIP